MSTHPSRNIRTHILAEALRLFIQHGYQGLSMREIAEAVGVTKAALYYHFRDKETLFLAILEEYLEEVGAALEEIQAREITSPKRIRLLVRYFLSQPAERQALVRFGSQEMAHLSAPSRQAFEYSYETKFISRVRGMIQAGIEARELKPLDPGLATWSLLGILVPYFSPASVRDLPPLDETIDQVLEIYLNGTLLR